MADLTTLQQHLRQHFGEKIQTVTLAFNELTIELTKEDAHAICLSLRDEPSFKFEMLLDVCGVDYLDYNKDEWQTEETTATGFSRGVDRQHSEKEHIENRIMWQKPRFAVVYHLLSYANNQRLRVKIFVDGEPPMVDSVVDIWSGANWYEREAFDLYGIVFKNHPDLRRLLTDYGFIGHPFRKDFPLIGNVEMRYDATLGRCVYEPVSIQPRTLVPKVILQDGRYNNNDERVEQEQKK